MQIAAILSWNQIFFYFNILLRNILNAALYLQKSASWNWWMLLFNILKSFVLNKSHLFLQPNHKNFWCISSKIIHQSIINYQSLINKVLLFSTCKNFFHFNFHSLLFNAKKNSTQIQTSDKQDNSAKHANFQNIKFQINCSSFLFENCFNCNFYGNSS